MPATDGHLLYLDLVDRIHETLLPRTYVEIGVEFGTSLQLVLPGTKAIGIDPEPKIRTRLDPTTEVFATTSDDFFAEHDVKALLGDRPIDLAYIDGLHLFEFALRDFMNIEAASSPDSVLLIDDSYPPTEVSAQRERSTNVWAGDVWKLIRCLIERRPDLTVTTIDVEPTGVSIVTGLDPSSKALADDYDAICEHYIGLPFSAIEDDKAAALHLAPPTWDTVGALLPDRPYRAADARLLHLQRALRMPTKTNVRYRTGQLLRHGPTAGLVQKLRGGKPPSSDPAS